MAKTTKAYFQESANLLKEKTPGKIGAIKKLLKSRGAKIAGGELLGYLILSRLFEAGNLSAEQNLQREAIQTQAKSVTPESLYYQAALPQAQEEEAQARQALLTQLSGGVIGPSLPRGYRVIGRQ